MSSRRWRSYPCNSMAVLLAREGLHVLGGAWGYSSLEKLGLRPGLPTGFGVTELGNSEGLVAEWCKGQEKQAGFCGSWQTG